MIKVVYRRRPGLARNVNFRADGDISKSLANIEKLFCVQTNRTMNLLISILYHVLIENYARLFFVKCCNFGLFAGEFGLISNTNFSEAHESEMEENENLTGSRTV